MPNRPSESSRRGTLVRKSAADIKVWAKTPEAAAQRAAVKARGGPTAADLEDMPELTDEQLANLKPAAEFWKARKKQITLRVDADVLDWFQQSGEGYLTRMNEALRRAMLSESAGGRRSR